MLVGVAENVGLGVLVAVGKEVLVPVGIGVGVVDKSLLASFEFPELLADVS